MNHDVATSSSEGAGERPIAAGAASAPRANRRNLLRAMFGSALGLGLTALGAASGLWAAAAARFMVPNVLTEPASRFGIGPPGDFPPGRVVTTFKEQHGIWVVNGVYGGKREIYVLSTVCTHLGCITLWQESEQKFKCPCHGSGFYADGTNFEGPAPRALDRYAIRLTEDGQLEVDKSRTFREELGQWQDAASYVPG
jgi:cytochrome b6-f complex iron-sulfur subunit